MSQGSYAVLENDFNNLWMFQNNLSKSKAPSSDISTKGAGSISVCCSEWGGHGQVRGSYRFCWHAQVDWPIQVVVDLSCYWQGLQIVVCS